MTIELTDSEVCILQLAVINELYHIEATLMKRPMTQGQDIYKEFLINELVLIRSVRDKLNKGDKR